MDNLATKWSTEHVKLWGHPTSTFETHKNSKGHKESLEKQIDIKRMLSKGNIYQQAVRGSAITKAKRSTQNRSVIKKTIYFITRKKWAVWHNFEEIVELLQEPGDKEIDAHLREGSERATYTSIKPVDSFIKCLGSFFKIGLLSHLTNAAGFIILLDETTDMANHAVLGIFVCYVIEHHKVVKEFLKLTELVGYVYQGRFKC